MIITPQDITSYLYCPIKHFDFQDKNQKTSDVWLSKVRETIIKTERRVMLHDSYITLKKLNRKWDDVWWEYCFSTDMELDKMKKLTVAASLKFAEYCKYDFSSDLFESIAIEPTITKDFSSDISISSSVDIIKRDKLDKKRHLYLIDIGSVDIDTIHTNIGIVAKILPFFINGCKELSYINVDFSKKGLNVSRFNFKEEHMTRYTDSLFYLCRGIRSRIKYPNMYNCKECNNCNEITSIK